MTFKVFLDFVVETIVDIWYCLLAVVITVLLFVFMQFKLACNYWVIFWSTDMGAVEVLIWLITNKKWRK